tara:strand:+ start:799 stop:1512 length:714 start_codon:yes stop_codon:yes gene_type:complete
MNKFYSTLRNENYKPFVETKGGGKFSADYLSWAVMHDYLKKNFQYVNYKIHEYTVVKENGTSLTVPYMLLPNGTAIVKITLTLEDNDGDKHSHEECLAIRNHSMQAASSPDCAQVENTIRRCIAKAGSMLTGFGIELWFGEDIRDLDYNPNIPNHAELSANTKGEVKSLPKDAPKLKRLANSKYFKDAKTKSGKSIEQGVTAWLMEKDRTNDEVLAKYIELKDLEVKFKKESEKESK